MPEKAMPFVMKSHVRTSAAWAGSKLPVHGRIPVPASSLRLENPTDVGSRIVHRYVGLARGVCAALPAAVAKCTVVRTGTRSVQERRHHWFSIR